MEATAHAPAEKELDRSALDEYEASLIDLGAAERAVRDATAAIEAAFAADGHDADVEARVAEARNAEHIAEMRLRRARDRATAKGDRLHPLQVRARLSAADDIRRRIDALEQDKKGLLVKRLEHLEAIQHIDRELSERNTKILELGEEIESVKTRSSVAITIRPNAVDPYHPPAGVLVRPSAWRFFVERARAQQLDEVQAMVNERTGDISSGSVKKEQ